MANTSSAKKQIRQQERKHVKNVERREAFRGARKELKNLITSKAPEAEMTEALSKFYKAVDKAAKSNTIHKNAASRYKSRVAKLVASAA